MKTIEERIKEYMDELFSMMDEYQVYSFKRDDFRLILEETAKVFIAEQKAIDDTELHQRFEKVLNGQKWDLVDKACDAFCATTCKGYQDTKGRCFCDGGCKKYKAFRKAIGGEE